MKHKKKLWVLYFLVDGLKEQNRIKRKLFYAFTLLLLIMVNCSSQPVSTKRGQESLRTPGPKSGPNSHKIATSEVENSTAIIPTMLPETPAAKSPISESAVPNISYLETSGLEITIDTSGGKCVETSKSFHLSPAIGKGLITYNRTRKELVVWGATGMDQPLFILPENPEEFKLSGWSISPDRKWLLVRNGLYEGGLEYWIINPKTGEKIIKQFKEVELGRSTLAWVQLDEIVIALMNQGDLYKWLIWKPFSNQEQIVSVRLPEIDLIAQENYYPVFDSIHGKVIYLPCAACTPIEWKVIDINDPKVMRTIDFGKDGSVSLGYLPLISPASKYMVFYFDLNKIWVLNYSGESIAKIVLPPDVQHMEVVRSFRWSVDGESIAVVRDSEDPPSPFVSVISISEKKISNFCGGFWSGNIDWSPDGNFIVDNRNQTADDPNSEIAFLDIHTGEWYKERISDSLLLIGWLQP